MEKMWEEIESRYGHISLYKYIKFLKYRKFSQRKRLKIYRAMFFKIPMEAHFLDSYLQGTDARSNYILLSNQSLVARDKAGTP